MYINSYNPNQMMLAFMAERNIVSDFLWSRHDAVYHSFMTKFGRSWAYV